MKTIFSFAFCESTLTPDVVWYSVTVGQSQRDKQAHSWLTKVARQSSAYFYAKHNAQVQQFIDSVARSLFNDFNPNRFLRRKMLPVTCLVNFLKSNPASFLNANPLKI